MLVSSCLRSLTALASLAFLLLPVSAAASDGGEPGCPSHTTMEMSYSIMQIGRGDQRLNGSDGRITEYARRQTAPTSYEVVCRVTDRQSRLLSVGTYQFQLKRADVPGGNPVLVRLTSIVDGEMVATTFDERGRRVGITNADGTTRRAYDGAGRVVLEETPGQRTRYTYDASSGKITSVDQSSRGQHYRAAYTYDGAANLVRAVSSDGHDIRLGYDGKARIAVLTDKGQRIVFTYNENDKPTVIDIPGTGTINVTYDDAGGIKEVQSTAGRAVAVKVTSMFQALLEVIRPAGVGINF